MGDGEELECITQISALQTKKTTKVVSVTLQMLLLCDTFFCLPCKNRSTNHIITNNIYCSCTKRKEKKEKQRKHSAYRREFRNTRVHNCFWEIGDNHKIKLLS